MSEVSDQVLLKQKVIENSIADTWEEAKKEWRLEFIFDKITNCVCCNHRTTENCVIKNKHNGSRLIVGNVCVNHFDEDELKVNKSCWSSLQTLQQQDDVTETDPKPIANRQLVELARRLNILSEYEARAYNKSRNYPNPLRDKWNQLIKYAFHPDRPLCSCREREYAKPKYGEDGRYFYGCGRFKQDDGRNCGFRKYI
jgi:hypothetical protein